MSGVLNKKHEYKALALGHVIDLNLQKPNEEHDLILRLFEVPIFENNGFIEIHGICQNEYYVSVSTYDECPEFNVFKIPYTGELEKYKWLENKHLDQETIEFYFNKYSKQALKNNSGLINNKKVILVQLDLTEIKIRIRIK